MKMWRIFAGFVMIVLFFMVLSLCNCAGSRKSQSEVEAEALYGETGEKAATEADTVKSQSDEDEVMRLLGLTKKSESSIPTTETVENKADTSAQNLEKESKKLEDELTQKNLEIANLKAEVAERDRRISELEVEADKPEETQKNKNKVRSSGTYKERYDYARTLYEAHNYRQAITEFAALISTDSNHELADNCQYWIGECNYGMRAYNQAIIEFEKVFTFNRSDKYDDAQLKLGYCYLRIGNVEKAKSEFNKLINNYPDSEFVAKAQYYLQQM